MRKTLTLTCFALLLSNSFTANALQVRMDYTGVATLATGIFADETVTLLNGYATDDFVSGSFFIDTDFIESGNNSVQQDEYVPQDSPNLNSVWALNVQYGSEFHTTLNNENDPTKFHHHLLLGDSINPFGPDDKMYYQANAIVNGDDRGGIFLNADNLISAGSPSLTGNSLTLALLDGLVQRLFQLSQQDYKGQYVVNNSNNQEIGRLEWNITGLTATPLPAAQVPLPPSLFSFACSVFIAMGFWRKHKSQGLQSVT